jgi:hypothetical protein
MSSARRMRDEPGPNSVTMPGMRNFQDGGGD